jgi:hypothetical protein
MKDARKFASDVAFLWEDQRDDEAVELVLARDEQIHKKLRADYEDAVKRLSRELVVWADENKPFTGPEVADLLRENEKLRAERDQALRERDAVTREWCRL